MENTSWQPASGTTPISVDFNWMPERDAVGLNTRGTVAALEAAGIELREGLPLNVWDADADDDGVRDDLIACGHVELWQDIWVLRLHWMRHQSDADTFSFIK